jgi:hypothetical protein
VTAKQLPLSLQAPDGSYYVCLTDGNGNLAPESTLPTGAATSANQTTEITALQAIVNQTAAVKITDNFLNSGTGLGVNINGQALVAVGTSALPTGAATSANQTNGSQLVQPWSYTPLTPGQHNLGVTTSTSLTIPTGALFAMMTVSGNSIRYTTDGTTTPTSTIGMPMQVNQSIMFSGATVLSNLRIIQQAATATIDVEYFK